MVIDLDALVTDFREVARLAGISLRASAVTIQRLSSPHKQPAALPAGKCAVYIFLWKGQCLKVGKAGPKSHARYTSQHYNYASSQSNLSKSLFASRESLALHELSEAESGSWIKANTERVNLLIDAACGMPVLTLLEAFVQCRLSPRFEGFESQRSKVTPNLSLNPDAPPAGARSNNFRAPAKRRRAG